MCSVRSASSKVADEKTDRVRAIALSPRELSRPLGDPAAVGLVVQPATRTRRLPNSTKNRIYSRYNQIVFTVKKSTARRL
jgi:hypothetical protein